MGGGLSLGAAPGGRGCHLPFVQLRGLHLWPPPTPAPGMGRGKQAQGWRQRSLPPGSPGSGVTPLAGAGDGPLLAPVLPPLSLVLRALPWLSGRSQSPAAITATCRAFPSPKGGPSGPQGRPLRPPAVTRLLSALWISVLDTLETGGGQGLVLGVGSQGPSHRSLGRSSPLRGRVASHAVDCAALCVLVRAGGPWSPQSRGGKGLVPQAAGGPPAPRAWAVSGGEGRAAWRGR